MTLEETVHQKVTSWRPTAEGRQTLTILDVGSGWRVRVAADRQDDLSCTLWELSLELSRKSPGGVQALRNWADGVVKRVTGLLEPLHIVEVDSERTEALLRSSSPTRRQDEAFYYELLLKGDREAQARRYRAAIPGDRREQIPFTLTHETLAKLAADIAGA